MWNNEPVENYPRSGGKGDKEEWCDAGVNLTMIYCNNFCKYHNVPPAQQ
jgi:hypothetical protein